MTSTHYRRWGHVRAGLVPLLLGLSVANAQDCSDPALALVNGRLLTMDHEYSTASSLLIEGERIAAIDPADLGAHPCVEVIDVGGRSVIPGLIDSHVHFIRQANMPGNDTRAAEAATSIGALQAIIAGRTREVPAGKFISVMGGLIPLQLQPQRRFPNLTELDAAASEHPVYIQMGFSGPAVTNSAGRAVFRAADVEVGEDGSIAAGQAAARAFATIKQRQSEADRRTGARRLMRYANSLGLTGVHDQGGVVFPGAGFFDTAEDYDTILALWEAGELTLRIRAHFGAADASPEPGGVESRLANAWPDFGDDMLRMAAMGEHVVVFPRDGVVNPAYADKVKAIARQGWTHEQHSVSEAENHQHYAAIKAAHAASPINDLRWSLTHVFEIGHPDSSIDLDELAALGMGLKLQSQAYVLRTDRFPLGRTLGGNNAGPLYRTLVDRGNIPLGAGTDGILVVPMNPWYSIYYMVTGRDVKGDLVNPGQTLTRLEALRLYTTGSAWFTFDEDDLGSIEVGKLADVVVLDNDYLAVSDAELKQLRAVLTVVDGKIVYRDGL